MKLLVTIHVFLVLKRLATLGTVIRPDVCVRRHVITETALVGKNPLTDGALLAALVRVTVISLDVPK